jgi:hypothetical protein
VAAKALEPTVGATAAPARREPRKPVFRKARREQEGAGAGTSPEGRSVVLTMLNYIA